MPIKIDSYTLYTPKELAKEKGVGLSRINKLRSTGAIKHIKLGNKVFIPDTELDKFFAVDGSLYHEDEIRLKLEAAGVL